MNIYNNYFINCNSKNRYNPISVYTINETEWNKQINESENSGLKPIYEKNIFVKDGYGALVGYCPENCQTIDELINYTWQDFHRNTPGNPTFTEKYAEILYLINLKMKYYGSIKKGIFGKNDQWIFDYSENSKTKNLKLFIYDELQKNGYKLIIGPGCYANGILYNKAIYCENYDEIIDNNLKSKILK